jgi:putative transposase
LILLTIVRYKKETKKVELNRDNVLGIDPGLNNWLTCVSNVGTSFIVDGTHIKSMNRWYHKQVSTIKENLRWRLSSYLW